MHIQSPKLASGCLLLLGSLALACSDTTSGQGGGTGGKQSSNGGSAAGGMTTAAGGTTTAAGGTTIAAGGTTTAAGGTTTASGGKTGSAGTVSTGGAADTGGTKGTGGSTPSAGGSVVTGGTTGAGGRNGGAGTVAAGGTGETGGTKPSGGSTPAAGTTAGGGRTGSGGSGAGGSSAGGTSGGAAGDSGTSPGCGKTSTITSSQYNNGNPISITVGSQQRRYILNVPTGYDNTKPYKFILGIHALDSNDKSVYNEKYYGLLPLSNNTVIFAAPNGVKNSAPCSGTGTGDSGCGWPSGNIPLIDAVVKQVTENFCVDMNHIYATGWSYGASMSYEIGCQRPLGGPTATANWGIRAIAIYAVRQMSGSCKPTIPIGYYLSHGTNDTVLGYDGGVTLTQTYATANGCTWATPPKASGSHICTNLSGCKTGYPVEFCSFVGGHTAYPDSGSPGSSWGPAEVWKFLDQF
jgi:poly(3-hydroxybutyrate) depolymerase